MPNSISLGDCSVNKNRMVIYRRLDVRTAFLHSPSLLFFLVNVTVTGTQCCHTPVYGAIALTWAVMRWDRVSICIGYTHISHTRPLSRADRSLLIISTCMFKL